MQQASGAAVGALLKITIDPAAPASTRLRAADIVPEHTSKAIRTSVMSYKAVEFRDRVHTWVCALGDPKTAGHR